MQAQSVLRTAVLINLFLLKTIVGLLLAFFTWEKPYRGDICNEMNIERFELRRDGTICFNHPFGSHDDVWWAVALSVYATIEMKKLELEAFTFG